MNIGLSYFLYLLIAVNVLHVFNCIKLLFLLQFWISLVYLRQERTQGGFGVKTPP